MKKFNVGDTVIGNSLNCYRITGKGCVMVVTNAYETSFSGIIEKNCHNIEVGEMKSSLRNDWFDLKESMMDVMDSAKKTSPKPKPVYHVPKRFNTGTTIRIAREVTHLNPALDYYEGTSGVVESYKELSNNQWIVRIFLINFGSVDVWEHELVETLTTVKPAVAERVSYPTPPYETAPTDVKTWGRVRETIEIKPAHKEAPKESVFNTKPKVFTITSRRKK